MSKKFKLNPHTGLLDRILGSDEVDALLDTLLTWKDPVDTYGDLPIIDNVEGDARFVKDVDELYVWSIPATSGTLGDWKQIGPTTSIAWGNITGTLSAQTDLQNELDGKQDDLTNTDIEIQDAVAKKHVQNTDTGTDQEGFDLDSAGTGAKLKSEAIFSADLTSPEPSALGVSFASPAQLPCCPKENAFDDSGATGIAANGSTQILGWLFTAPTVINRYEITARGSNGDYRNWVLEGSNDTTTGFDGSWTPLDTVVNGNPSAVFASLFI